MSDGKTFHTDAMACPGCGYVLSAATAVTGEQAPSAGDFTVCLMCGVIAVFGPGAKSLRRLRPSEESKLEPDIRRLVRQLRARVEARLRMS